MSSPKSSKLSSTRSKRPARKTGASKEAVRSAAVVQGNGSAANPRPSLRQLLRMGKENG